MADPEADLRDFLKFLYGIYWDCNCSKEEVIFFAETEETGDIYRPVWILVRKFNKVLKSYEPDYIVPGNLIVETVEFLRNSHLHHSWCLCDRPLLETLIIMSSLSYCDSGNKVFYWYFTEKLKDVNFSKIYSEVMLKLINSYPCKTERSVHIMLAFFLKIGTLAGIKELVPSEEQIQEMYRYFYELSKVDDPSRYHRMSILHCYIASESSIVSDIAEYVRPFDSKKTLMNMIENGKNPNFTYHVYCPTDECLEQESEPVQIPIDSPKSVSKSSEEIEFTNDQEYIDIYYEIINNIILLPVYVIVS